jgi:hypothetical protein
VLTLSGERFDATAYYVGRVLQFHLGGTNQYTFARVVAQSGADLTIDQVPANLDDTWHGYILPESAAPSETEVADALLMRDWEDVTGTVPDRSTLNALRFLRNKRAIAMGTLTVMEEDDSTPAWTADVVGDAEASPITSIDPT